MANEIQMGNLRSKLMLLFQLYLNERLASLAFCSLVVCFGIGHLVMIIAGAFPDIRTIAYLGIVITTIGVIYFLKCLWILFVYIAKDIVPLLVGKFSEARWAEIQHKCTIHFVHAPEYSWWQNTSLRWLLCLFPLLNVVLVYWEMTHKTAEFLARPALMMVAVPYAAANGVAMLTLFIVFRWIDAAQNQQPFYKNLTIPQIVLMLSVYLVGQVMGQVAALNFWPRFINAHFPSGIQAEQLIAKDWRMNERWCHGQQIEYQAVSFPFAQRGRAEQILCLDSSYQGRFKKNSLIYASGPGSVLGTTITTIASPDNGVAAMPTPVWD